MVTLLLLWIACVGRIVCADRVSLTLTTDEDLEDKGGLAEYVDVLRGIGAANSRISTGNVLPLLSVPRGMTHWSVASTTDFKDNWYMKPTEVWWDGIRCTHQPSPWIGDYGQFQIGVAVDSLDRAYYSLDKSQYHPYLFETNLTNYCSSGGCTQVSFSPSHRGGWFRVGFPSDLRHKKRITITIPDGHGLVSSQGNTSAHGYSTLHEGNASNFKHHFSAVFDADGNASWVVSKNQLTIVSDDAREVNIRIGTSFISMEQACLNRKRELDIHSSVWDVSRETRNKWEKMLTRVQVEGGLEEQKRMLYTSLYRALLFPRNLAEIDAKNRVVHWSPYTGKVHKGPFSTDSGFWDAYRTLYPMLHLVYPEVAKEVLKGWINAMKENNGRVPEWSSPGFRASMVGSMSDVTMSEAIVNGVLTGEDAGAMYKAIVNNAFSEEHNRGNDLTEYLEKGYVAGKVALTLNFLLADHAISKAARFRNDTHIAEVLENRTSNWNILFDQRTGFFRSRSENGTFEEPFDSYAWQGPFTEGGAWQYRFYVPFNGVGLASAYGGPEGLCKALDNTMTHIPATHLSGVIHEATELAAHCFGQYSHNNQPAHHQLYMYGYSSCPQHGQAYIHKTLKELYGPHGFAGDEDNGEMSSWYILSSIGLYALFPGSGTYHVGAAPLFSRVRINDSLVISRTSNANVHSSVSWNNRTSSLTGTLPVELPFHELSNGGVLEFIE